MEAENLCGSRLIPTSFGERILNKLLFEFADGFIEINAFLNHLGNKRFQFFFHDPPADVFPIDARATTAPRRGTPPGIWP
jgi:hypothetical protein